MEDDWIVVTNKRFKIKEKSENDNKKDIKIITNFTAHELTHNYQSNDEYSPKCRNCGQCDCFGDGYLLKTSCIKKRNYMEPICSACYVKKGFDEIKLDYTKSHYFDCAICKKKLFYL